MKLLFSGDACDQRNLGHNCSVLYTLQLSLEDCHSNLLIRSTTELPEDHIEAASSATIDTAIDCAEPAESEISRAIGKLRNGKAQRSVEFLANF